jgi:hypothetical protein
VATPDDDAPNTPPAPAARDEGPNAPFPVINIDEHPWNRDWAKRTWDLGIDNVEDLRRSLAFASQTVEDFKQLPV